MSQEPASLKPSVKFCCLIILLGIQPGTACKHFTAKKSLRTPSEEKEISQQTLPTQQEPSIKTDIPLTPDQEADRAIAEYLALVKEYQGKSKDQTPTEFGKIINSATHVTPGLFKAYLLSDEFDTIYADELKLVNSQKLQLAGNDDGTIAKEKNAEETSLAINTAGKTFLILGLLGYGSVALNLTVAVMTKNTPSVVHVLIQWAVSSTALYLGWKHSTNNVNRTEKELGHWVVILNGSLSVWGAWNAFKMGKNFNVQKVPEATVRMPKSWSDYIPTSIEGAGHLSGLMKEKLKIDINPVLMARLVQGTLIGAGAIGAVMGVSRILGGVRDLEKEIETESLYLTESQSQDLIAAQKIHNLTLRLIRIKGRILETKKV